MDTGPGRTGPHRNHAQQEAASAEAPPDVVVCPDRADGTWPGTAKEFRADVLELLRRLDATARTGYLPTYLPHGADVTRMARTVRMLGEVRRGHSKDEADVGRADSAEGIEQARIYALPAERREPAVAPEPWEQIASEYEQLMVLGDPGMGKSWLIRTETRRLAQAAAEALADPSAGIEDVLIPVPIRADVLATAPGQDLAEIVGGYLIHEGLVAGRSAGRLRQRIVAGGIVLLVDALDEVPRETVTAGGQAPSKRLQDILRRWAADCQGTARCVLTSRLAGYSGPPLPGAREAELLPFTPQDTQTALHAWDLPTETARRIDRLLSDPGVASMARLPLLLALMCSLATDPQYQDALPDTRGGLYEAVLWQFLSSSHRADHRSPAAALTPREREGLLQILARVAFFFATSRQGWVDRMPHSMLAVAICGTGKGGSEPGASGAEDVIRRCEQAGVLVPAGNPRIAGQAYMFLHRRMAEYLVARHLRDMPPAQRMQAVAEHQWFDPDWAEVIPMLGSLLATHEPSGAKALLTHFLFQSPDPLHRAFHTAIRIVGEHPEPDRLLEPSQAHYLRKRAIGLLERDATRARLLGLLTKVPSCPQVVLDSLLTVFRTSHWPVRSAIGNVLASCQDPAITQALIPLLLDGDSAVRAAAIAALAGRQDPAITGALIPVLRDDDNNVRHAAVDALASRRGPGVAEALITVLRDRDGNVRAVAARALASRQDPATTEALIPLLRDDVRHVRYASARALANNQDPATTRALIALLCDRGAHVRAAAARALASCQDPSATHALIGLLQDHYGDVRAAAARALADRQDPAITEALIPVLRDSDRDVRAAAARALASRQDPAITQALIPLLRDNVHYVRYAATMALASCQDPSATHALIGLLQDHYGDVRAAAARALADRQDPAITEALIPVLRDSDRDVRAAAARALAGRQDPAITHALVALLHDNDGQVRCAAARALASDQDRATTQALIALLHDNLHYVRAGVVYALADHEDLSAARALAPLLHDRDHIVRTAVVYALAKRSEPWVLTWASKQSVLLKRGLRRTVLFELADQIIERDYLRLPPHQRPHILRRLGKLTRKVAPAPRQHRFTNARQLQELIRRVGARLRRRPFWSAAAFALATVAGVVGNKLTGHITPALAAFAGLLVAGMVVTYLAERGADTPAGQDADQ